MLLVAGSDVVSGRVVLEREDVFLFLVSEVHIAGAAAQRQTGFVVVRGRRILRVLVESQLAFVQNAVQVHPGSTAEPNTQRRPSVSIGMMTIRYSPAGTCRVRWSGWFVALKRMLVFTGAGSLTYLCGERKHQEQRGGDMEEETKRDWLMLA